MKKWVVRWKKIGETPLEVLKNYRAKTGLPDNMPLAYAGRLDPMAEGKLLILIGDECKVQEKYHDLDKAYRFEVLLGFSSDTGDVLGMAQRADSQRTYTKKEITDTLKTLLGKQEFPYPQFSSRPVNGKPLHMWTLEGRLDEIEIPTKISSVYTLRLEKLEEKKIEIVRSEIFEKINSIPEVTDPRKALGEDFRRVPIRARWTELFDTSPNTSFQIITLYGEASSGTYMRTLAEEVGKRLGTSGLAYRITRTKIGRRFNTPFGAFWYKTF